MFCVKPVKYDRCASQNVQDIIRSVWWCFHGRFTSKYIKIWGSFVKIWSTRIGKLNARMIWDWAGFDDTFSCNLPNGCEWPGDKWVIFASFHRILCLEIRNLWTSTYRIVHHQLIYSIGMSNHQLSGMRGYQGFSWTVYLLRISLEYEFHSSDDTPLG